MRIALVMLCLVPLVAGCGGGSPRDYTCADVRSSSEKTEQLAKEVLRGAGEEETDANMRTAVERANQTCGRGGGSKTEDKPYSELVSLIKLESHLQATDTVADPYEEAQAQEDKEVASGVDLIVEIARLPSKVKRYCTEVIGKGTPAPNYREILVNAIAQLRRNAASNPEARAVAERALSAFDRWQGKCAPALRQRVVDAVTGN